MSATQDLITSLEKLLKLHKSLYELAVRKTEYIKVGDMDALNKIINEEQSHIIAIQQFEKKRQETVTKLLPNRLNPSVLECIEMTEGHEKEKLSNLANQLNEVLFALKEKNYLNQQLVHQSLQFVNVSLSLLKPQPESMNYGPPKGKSRTNVKDTLFNSKA
jgi:flagellar biosynthesis/type III secretory pathway chaperone